MTSCPNESGWGSARASEAERGGGWAQAGGLGAEPPVRPAPTYGSAVSDSNLCRVTRS
ncbi:hypothetical protein GCM10022232_27390 [Streptomyces plumbiresistens]|uniref:Uncharacterized protein n=1 Tax=Streptomyces plumbiresistens TaxID=511811 RepID=A0ABP7R2U6_9ACTN